MPYLIIKGLTNDIVSFEQLGPGRTAKADLGLHSPVSIALDDSLIVTDRMDY